MAVEGVADIVPEQQYPLTNPEFPFGVDSKSFNSDIIEDFHDRISKSKDNLII